MILVRRDIFMKKFKVKIDIFDIYVDFWIGGTEEEFCKAIKKQFKTTFVEDGAKGMYCEFANKKNKNKIKDRIIWVASDKKQKYCLIHEISHAVFDILSYHNIRLIVNDLDRYIGTSTEIYAYLTDFLVEEADKRL